MQSGFVFLCCVSFESGGVAQFYASVCVVLVKQSFEIVCCSSQLADTRFEVSCFGGREDEWLDWSYVVGACLGIMSDGGAEN